ncbi:hypothetical protein E1A91_D01G080200v1 [Gossypium mustelinum]|uniref:Uncharacterized protein n=1 Tax=Gossypium mustelinum TaxID=34275 RepID=A0A5D2W4H8_GOSMU|nr:hypothetical protein E1A91_D01G080200v1 [Gossypium mustelinum]
MRLSSMLKAPSGQVKGFEEVRYQFKMTFISSQTNSRNVFLTLLFLQFQLLSKLVVQPCFFLLLLFSP